MSSVTCNLSGFRFGRSITPHVRVWNANGIVPGIVRPIGAGSLHLQLFSCRRRRGFLAISSMVGDSVLDSGAEESASDHKSRNGLFPAKMIQTITATLPTAVLTIRRDISPEYLVGGICVVFALLIVSLRRYVLRARNIQRGTVVDLVRRGQLRYDRRGISKPIRYEDPFNNPLLKFGKNNSTIEMFGKVYRLAPVTLTNEQQSSHRSRRSRSYQWKRPTLFLKEGDPIPPEVDPETIRWIPANHPFATTTSDIDESVVQSNAYQKEGVPFRIREEHEALRKKLESLQNPQKLNKLSSVAPNHGGGGGGEIPRELQGQRESNPGTGKMPPLDENSIRFLDQKNNISSFDGHTSQS